VTYVTRRRNRASVLVRDGDAPALLVAVPVLLGSLVRIPMGILTDASAEALYPRLQVAGGFARRAIGKSSLLV
jgi:hypothetical protein